MKYGPDDMLNEICLYTLIVYGKVNGEKFEMKYQVITRLCFSQLCLDFQHHMINRLKKEGVFDYYDELYVTVYDRKAL